MFTNLFTNCGITRDSALWFWGKVLSIATLVTSGVLDLPYWAGYLGIHATTTEIHWVQVLAVIALYISGQNSTSNLKGKE